MKKTLLSFLFIGAAASMMAENATLDFTYAQDQLFNWGKGKKEAIDVAICINNPSLAGKKLTGFKAYISTAEGIDNTSLWLSKELTLENKVNVPDVLSVEVAPVAATVGEYDLQVLETTLAEPYVLTDEPLYVGYSMTVAANTTDAQKNPIVLSEGVNPDGLYLHMKQSVLKWMDYSANAQGVAFIVAEIEGEYPEYSLGFQSYEPIYAQEDEVFYATFNVSNIGINMIRNIEYTYTVDDSAEKKDGFVALLAPLTPSLSLTSPVTLPFAGISGIGSHTLNVEIVSVNGEENNSAAPSITSTVNVIPFVPVHRPLVEEFTGLWCGWCTRGYLAMEMIAEKYGDDVVAIAYHNGDPMAVTNDYPVSVPGYPSASVNRNTAIDPYYGSSSSTEFGISNDIDESISEFTIASIDLEAALEGENVNVETTVKFIQSMDNANYQVGYVLVSNGLLGTTWAQSNYYSGDNGYSGSPLEELTEWPDPVIGLVFNDVAIDVDGMRGVAGSIPANVLAGQEINHTYSFNIAGNDLVQNPENLVVTAFIIDKSTNKVINANKYALSQSSAINTIEDGKAMVVNTEYFDLSGRKVANPSKGIFIKRSTLSDGKAVTSKVVVR